jgi:hypothetical protein
MRLPNKLSVQIPDWARPSNPVLRYLIEREDRRRSWLSRWLVRLLMIGTVALLLAISFGAYQNDSPIGVRMENESAVHAILYFPLLVMQFGALMVAMILTSDAISHQRQNGAWEAVKITSHGAEMTVRSHWAAVFYQMRWLLILLILPRLIFAGQMLVDLTDYQGYHLDLYISGITPEVSVEVAIMLLAALMTATLLQILVIVGLNAAFGLFLSTLFRNYQVTRLTRIILVMLQFALALAFVGAGELVLDQEFTTPTSETSRWFSLLLMSTMGDFGLRFMNLRTFFQAWTDVDYAILLGAAILIVVLIQAALTSGFINWTVRRASNPGHE